MSAEDVIDWAQLLEEQKLLLDVKHAPEHVSKSLVGRLRDDPDVRRNREDRLEEQRRRREEWHGNE